jgi:hypothetical protein
MDPFTIAILLMIAAAAITAMTSKGPPKPVAANISQFTAPQSAEGSPQGVVFGDVWVSDFFVLYFGNLKSQPIYASGGKK